MMMATMMLMTQIMVHRVQVDMWTQRLFGHRCADTLTQMGAWTWAKGAHVDNMAHSGTHEYPHVDMHMVLVTTLGSARVDSAIQACRCGNGCGHGQTSMWTHTHTPTCRPTWTLTDGNTDTAM